MSNHTDDLLAELADHFAEHGESFTYTPRGGSARTITAIVLNEPLRFENRSAHRFAMKDLLIRVYNDDTTGVATPQEQDEFLRDSDTREPQVPYLFQAIEEGDAVSRVFRITESPRIVRSGFREENTI